MADLDCAADVACPPRPCRSVFDRVVVSHLRVGGTVVYWALLPEFVVPGPLTFTLQAGKTSSPDADDWEDVGLPVTDRYAAVDDERRCWGKELYTHYRVKLEAGGGTWLSDPVGGMGTLDRRDWILAGEILRREELWHRMNYASQQGWLLKRRVTGKRCPTCVHPISGEVSDPDCPDCFGTGLLCGYYYPFDCVWAALAPRATRVHRQDGRGTVDDQVVSARMTLSQLLGEDDVWVAARTDDRYFVHRVRGVSEIRGVPIAGEVELRLIPFSSGIYDIAVPQQLDRLAALGS